VQPTDDRPGAWDRVLRTGLADAARALERAIDAAERSSIPSVERVGLLYAVRSAAEAVARASGVAEGLGI
jgi:hypothetical protein